MNVFDLIRAYSGLQILFKAFDLWTFGSSQFFIPKAMICFTALLGLLMQHFFCRIYQKEMPIPLAYAIGLSAALLPPHIIGLALFFGISSTVAMRSLSLGLTLTGVTLIVLGRLLGQPFIPVATVGVFFIAPTLLCEVCQRRPVLLVKRRLEIANEPLREVTIKINR